MVARSVPARILGLVLAAGILFLAFFFLLAAVVAGVVVAAVLLARVWWVSRRIRKTAESQIVTTEYRVVERERIAESRLPDESAVETPEDRPREGGSPGNHAPDHRFPPARE